MGAALPDWRPGRPDLTGVAMARSAPSPASVLQARPASVLQTCRSADIQVPRAPGPLRLLPWGSHPALLTIIRLFGTSARPATLHPARRPLCRYRLRRPLCQHRLYRYRLRRPRRRVLAALARLDVVLQCDHRPYPWAGCRQALPRVGDDRAFLVSFRYPGYADRAGRGSANRGSASHGSASHGSASRSRICTWESACWL
ncbi:hypothetical protein GGP44_002956 [Salinibacter ruber]|nr:hypothetical protein [Salinibacter ruber]